MANETEIIPEIRFKPVVKRYKEMTELMASVPSEVVEDTISSGWLTSLREGMDQSAQCCLEGDGENPLTTLFRSFLGRKRSEQNMDDLAWRVAACYETLNAGQDPHSSFAREKIRTKPMWMGLMITSSAVSRLSRTMKPLMEVFFRVLSGPFGGLTFKQLIPYSWYVRKLGRELGGGTRGRRIPDYRMLGGFWLVGRLNMDDPQATHLADFRVPPVAIDHNRELKKIRDQPCPVKFTHACHECWVGWMDRIPVKFGAAKCSNFRRKNDKGKEVNQPFTLFERPVHPKHFVLRKCTFCKREGSFDPSHRTRYCVSCQVKLVRTYGGLR